MIDANAISNSFKILIFDDLSFDVGFLLTQCEKSRFLSRASLFSGINLVDLKIPKSNVKVQFTPIWNSR